MAAGETPNAAINTAFNTLLKESQAGNLHAFVIITYFGDNYRTTLPEPWNKSPGTTGAFGDNKVLIKIIGQSIDAIGQRFSPSDRAALAAEVMGALFGLQTPTQNI